MAKEKILLDLFEKKLQNLYNSEILIVNSIPKLMQHVRDEELKDAVNLYYGETYRQKERLTDIGNYLNIKVAVQDGNIIRALIEDVKWLYDEFAKGLLMDVGIVSKLRNIQHFQISAYETALLYSQHLKVDEVSDLFKQTLDEAYEGDEIYSYHAKRLLQNLKLKNED
ncbi:DUF892 family protein [Winogradskyella ursingii]|uniref:DUF892 family protein n=1 Tax=Winogradskyella ursingii TaxID=2686079 RepID=UPI0015C8DA4D|nr:DUF892 family protein [Winogradskyella ursingii]